MLSAPEARPLTPLWRPGCWVATAVLAVLAAGVTPRSAVASETCDIQDYFPLRENSAWVLQDTDGEPADEEGFSWTVSGAAPQAIGSHQAWAFVTDTVAASDPREGDRLYWNLYNGGADLGLFGLYENAGANPLAANQTLAFSQPLRVGTQGMTAGWSAISSATTAFRITLPFVGTVTLDGTVTATASLVEHRDQLDTPLGTFYDIAIITLDVSGTVLTYSLPLYRGTLFLARDVGLVRFTRSLDPASPQAQALVSGQLGGVTIVPPPPPAEQGLTMDAPDRTTSETGDTARFTVVLNSTPRADVTVTLTVDAPTEAGIAVADRSLDLVFTPANWATPQEVVLTGVDDPDWDGHQAYHLAFGIHSADPGYAGLDPAPWTLTFTNLDDENLDIEDYFVLAPGSHWDYVAFDERSGPIAETPGATWTAEDEQPLMHGVPTTAIRTDSDTAGNPLNGAANFWSLSPAGDLRLHGARLPVQIERDVELMGSTYHVVVPPQTVEFAVPLVAGTRGMVAHAVLTGATTASVQVTGLPLFTEIPIDVASRVELLGMRDSKLTPLGRFDQVPFLQLTLSVAALGESLQDQGGILFLARGTGVIGQNAAGQPDGPIGLALAAGTVGTTPIQADDPTDRLLNITLALHPGWNLVAIPFTPATAAPADLFGDAIAGCAWELQGRDCVPASAIRPGHAYWVYRNPAFAPGQPVADLLVTGKPGARTTRNVRRGWILAGVVSDSPGATCPLPLPAVPSGQPACRTAWLWQDGQLTPVRSLTAGVGAWLLVETTGTLDLAAPP